MPLRGLRTEAELRASVDNLAILLSGRMKAAVDDDITSAFKHGLKTAFGELRGTETKAEMGPEDTELVRSLQGEPHFSRGYTNYQGDLRESLQRTISIGIADGQSISQIVSEMGKSANLQTYKLVRLARTEINNIYNEGRLRGYLKGEKELKRQFKYRLIVMQDRRTCRAHLELASRIPGNGLILGDLIQLQQEIGNRHGLSLKGHSLLHPNQRTVLVRA